MYKIVDNSSDRSTDREVLDDAVTDYLESRFGSDAPMRAYLDRWAQQRIALENRAKLDLALESADPVEHCFQNLIREIDSEAETGIFLATPAGNAAQLCRLSGEEAMSGQLHQELPTIAHLAFPDEFEHSREDLDLVWISVNARYDRANLDAEVSELILMHLMGTEEQASDMADALRAIFYTFHEARVRRRFDLPELQDMQASRRLTARVTQLTRRAGDYDARISSISRRAGTS
jgi:hypothetical protein